MRFEPKKGMLKGRKNLNDDQGRSIALLDQEKRRRELGLVLSEQRGSVLAI